LGEVMAIFCPRSLFKRVDLPTLGGPIMAMKPDKKLIWDQKVPLIYI
jgi:hypothetical protein